MRGLPKMICNFSAFYQSLVSFMEKGRWEEGTNDKEYNITEKINMPGERGGECILNIYDRYFFSLPFL